MEPVASGPRFQPAANTRRPGDDGCSPRQEDCVPEREVVAGLGENRAALLEHNDLVGPFPVPLRGHVPPHTAGNEQQQCVAKEARPVSGNGLSHTRNVVVQAVCTKRRAKTLRIACAQWRWSSPDRGANRVEFKRGIPRTCFLPQSPAPHKVYFIRSVGRGRVN